MEKYLTKYRRLHRLRKIPLVGGVALVAALVFVSISPILATSSTRASESKNDAKVVVEEYMSLTCPHCADFHHEVYLQLAEGVFKSPHVVFHYRDFPLDRVALQAAILSRCGGEKLRSKLVGAMLDKQDKWRTASEPVAVIISILQLVGVDEARAKKCLSDKSLERAVLVEQLEGNKAYKISSTPTIVVAGEKIEGKLTAKRIISAVNKALKKAGLPASQ